MKALKKGAKKHRFSDNQIPSVDGLTLILKKYENFLNVATRAQNTRWGYRRAVRDLCVFTGFKALADTFRGKFLWYLREMYDKNELNLPGQLNNKHQFVLLVKALKRKH